MKKRLKTFLAENKQSPIISQLTPDASTREYFRVRWFGKDAIACVYPFNELCQGQFEACLDVTQVFRAADLPVAEIFASDPKKQIIIHEDFGNKILRDVLKNAGKEERDRLLCQAIQLIARIQAATPIAFRQNSISSKLKFDEEKLSWELNFFKTHYFEVLKKKPLADTYNELIKKEFSELSRELEKRAKVLAHRDFHAANLMVKDGELKIIDHQDARIGTVSYDLVSLLLDRVTTLPTPEWLAEKQAFLLAEREKYGLEKINEAEFSEEFRLQTIQRCLKAIGTFSFQSAVRGKIHFTEYIRPMFEIILRAAENLNRFHGIQEIIRKELKA